MYLDDHPFLCEFVDVFIDEILRMTPWCDIDLLISIILKSKHISWAPCCMTTQGLSDIFLSS